MSYRTLLVALLIYAPCRVRAGPPSHGDTVAVLQANECSSSGSECLSSDEPKNAVAMIQTNLQMNIPKGSTHAVATPEDHNLQPNSGTAQSTLVKPLDKEESWPIATLKASSIAAQSGAADVADHAGAGQSGKNLNATRDPDLSLPGKCGFNAECPRDYKLAEVNSTTDPSHVEKNSRTLARLHDTLRKACEVSADEKNAILKNGGWCYDVPMSKVVKLNGTNVDMDYRLPLHHVVADEVIVSILSKSVLLKEDGSCCLSLTDFGAGVGQYGHALRGRLAKLEYHGYDGAGNVEEFTNNYVKFGDLTRPLSLKQTDWVLSAEVGEHIPHEYEAQVIANIHAHNCKGVILTWAVPGQHGNGHINCHSNQYLIQIFEELGYTFNKDLSAALRAHRTNGAEWFQHSAMAFDRITKPASCHGQDS